VHPHAGDHALDQFVEAFLLQKTAQFVHVSSSRHNGSDGSSDKTSILVIKYQLLALNLLATSGVTDGKMTASSSRLGIYVSTFWENGLPARYLNGPSDTLLNHC
jgi:hypothetical protein